MKHSILNQGIDLQSVLTDTGEGGILYCVTEKDEEATNNRQPCQYIVVSMENGSLAPIPFAVCVFHDRRVRLVNLTRAAEVEMLDRLATESDIALPPGVIAGPGHPGYEKPN